MVKCADCGFLAARNITTRELEEVEEVFREKGIPVIIEWHDFGGEFRQPDRG